ncbi:MAG: hypothetical protein J0I47_10970 [Sphingomonas sp.]|uniref:hypothetical protein n=1 Tax=Sphingomonas sp. TaxID=28214 RepID=UPI001ACFD9A2|nr:hypothetical protein [Sphingomonas sp.]MBN8808733.1 hypothetical protein [Sphingomonas sp.]
MRHFVTWATSAAVLATGIGYAAPGGETPPKARYQMDVSTASGFMAGGVNPMKMMFGGRGGGDAVAHQLTLRLGSTLAATGAPAADHFMPAGMNLGSSVPLVTPTPTAATPGPVEERQPGEMRRPKGRLLLYWGCGAHAGPGQPIVIDFSKLGQTQFPPGLFSVSVPAETGPTPANSRTYGSWPSGRSTKPLKADSSLIGEHRVAGNYSPEMKFALDQDFMAALRASSQGQPDGSQLLNWNAVPAATGYYAWLIGAKSAGDDSADMVWWTSASGKEFGGGLTEWLSPATVAGLIARRVVMPPSQTSCQVPAEVKGMAGGFMMTQLYAYGPERTFAYPPRPANPRAAWHPDWTARIRYRANTALLLGMPGMGGDRSGDGSSNGDANGGKKKCRPRIGLGGLKLC